MAADNSTGPASTENNPPPPPQLTPAEQLIALQAENRLLRELRLDNGKPKGPDHRVGRKPDSFKGTPADKDTHAIQQWLNRMDTYWRLAGVEKDDKKIDFMREFLVDHAGKEYDARVESSGEFVLYQDLKDWLLEHYSTIDPVNTYRDRFFGCYQEPGESFDSYFHRYRTAKNALDEPLPKSYIVYLFVAHLQDTYVTQIRSDKEFADYGKVTLEDVLSRLKRANPAVLPDTNHDISRAAAHGNQQGMGIQFVGAHWPKPKKRKNPQQHQQRPHPTGNPQPTGNYPTGNRPPNSRTATGNSTNASLRELPSGQQAYIDRHIKRGGGGTQFWESVQQNVGWKTRAAKLKLCFKCGAPQHPNNICPALPPPARTVGALNQLSLFEDDDDDDTYVDTDPLNFFPQV
jgi:hypothetical protein